MCESWDRRVAASGWVEFVMLARQVAGAVAAGAFTVRESNVDLDSLDVSVRPPLGFPGYEMTLVCAGCGRRYVLWFDGERPHGGWVPQPDRS